MLLVLMTRINRECVGMRRKASLIINNITEIKQALQNLIYGASAGFGTE